MKEEEDVDAIYSVQIFGDVDELHMSRWRCRMRMHYTDEYDDALHCVLWILYSAYYVVQQCQIIEWSFTLLCQSWKPCVEVQCSTSLQSTRSLDPLPCQAWHTVPLAQGARHRGSEELIPAWSLGSHQVRGGQASISPIISFPHIYTFVWGQVFQYQVI